MQLELHSVIWLVGSLLIFILGFIVKGIFFKTPNGLLKTLYDQQMDHRIKMEQYITNSEKSNDKQNEILNKMFELLGKIAYFNEIQANLAKNSKNAELIQAIEKLSAKIK